MRPCRDSGRRRPLRAVRASACAVFGLGALAPSAAIGARISLPYCSSTSLQGAAAAFESAVASVELQWKAEAGDAEKAALDAALREEATRRGYRIGAAESSTRWVLVRGADPAGGFGAGERPLTPDGYAAALADRVRRASPRSVTPTRASLELLVMKFDVAIWTGEARFDPDPDRSVESATAALRGLLALLPRFGRFAPTFERLAPDSIAAYYTAHLSGRSFFCPSLPYPVHFPDLERAYHQGGRRLLWKDTLNSHQHEDATIFPACLDLVLHAGSALPKAIPGVLDVAAMDLWRDVTLFDVYRDATGAALNVEVRLHGDTRGYKVAGTRLLDAPEAAKRAEALRRFEESTARTLEATGR